MSHRNTNGNKRKSGGMDTSQSVKVQKTKSDLRAEQSRRVAERIASLKKEKPSSQSSTTTQEPSNFDHGGNSTSSTDTNNDPHQHKRRHQSSESLSPTLSPSTFSSTRKNTNNTDIDWFANIQQDISNNSNPPSTLKSRANSRNSQNVKSVSRPENEENLSNSSSDELHENEREKHVVPTATPRSYRPSNSFTHLPKTVSDSTSYQTGNKFHFWKRKLRDILETIASILIVAIIILAVVTLSLSYFSEFSLMSSSSSLPYCDTNSHGKEGCSICPDHGICESGVLVACEPQYSIGESWSRRQYCYQKLSTKLWVSVGWLLPYITAMFCLLVFFQWRFYRERKCEARADRWLRQSWALLDERENDPLPLDWLKQKILMDEYVTVRKMRKYEWIWDRYVAPDLLKDPRLRVEQRPVQGEVMECLTIMSPKHMRAFSPRGLNSPQGHHPVSSSPSPSTSSTTSTTSSVNNLFTDQAQTRMSKQQHKAYRSWTAVIKDWLLDPFNEEDSGNIQPPHWH